MTSVPTSTSSTRAERPALSERTVPFAADDGFGLNLVNVRGEKEPTRGPVLLVHGAGVRANLFRAPVETSFVDVLVAQGYDVWLENWRASIDLPFNDWTLDQAALYDHPAAVRTVVAETGADTVKAVIHCQGSTSFMMSAMAGLVPQVDTVIANAVSVHPVVPKWSQAKLRYATPLIQRLIDHLDPSWGRETPKGLVPRAVRRFVEGTHHECDNSVCRLVSFTYGTGFPALWRHENLNDATHDEFIPREFGKVPLSFFRQIARCVARGRLVSVEGLPGLPADFTAREPQTDARFVFTAGRHNQCFLPESQQRSYAFFDRFRPGHHALHVLPDYSHLDVFLGDRAATEVFPLLLDELEGARV